MEPTFWHARWNAQQIGFHRDTVNPYLARWWSSLEVPASARVLVPLCGKSRDLRWLQQRGHTVVGVELSGVACRAFFSETELPHTVEDHGPYQRWVGTGEAAGIELLQGDFFAAPVELIGQVDAVYDRASLIALPPALRAKHVARLSALLPSGAPGLLVSLDYPQDEKKGPPFSVPMAEVNARLRDAFEVELLEDVDLLAQPDAPNRWGLSALSEQAYQLRRR